MYKYIMQKDDHSQTATILQTKVIENNRMGPHPINLIPIICIPSKWIEETLTIWL